jgi:hypothetical protein
MQETINIKCPQCKSSNIQVNIEKDGRLVFDCLDCKNHFFSSENLKMKTSNTNEFKVNFSISVDSSNETSELDQRIIELVQKGNYYKAVKFYQEQKKSSLVDAKTYVDELTGYQENKQTTDYDIFGFVDKPFFILRMFIIAALICLFAYLLG